MKSKRKIRKIGEKKGTMKRGRERKRKKRISLKKKKLVKSRRNQK